MKSNWKFTLATLAFFFFLAVVVKPASAEKLHQSAEISPFSAVLIYEKDGNILARMSTEPQEETEIINAYWTVNGEKQNLSDFWIVKEKDQFLILLEAKKAMQKSPGKIPMLCLLTKSQVIPEKVFCLAVEAKNVTFLSEGKQVINLTIP